MESSLKCSLRAIPSTHIRVLNYTFISVKKKIYLVQTNSTFSGPCIRTTRSAISARDRLYKEEMTKKATPTPPQIHSLQNFVALLRISEQDQPESKPEEN
jgi:hypothetical protein